MEDPTTIALNLTFLGTLGVALVMFFGLFLVFVATLVIAGLGRLAAVTIMAVGRVLLQAAGRTARPAETVQPAAVRTIGTTQHARPPRLRNRRKRAKPAKPAKPEARQEGTRPVPGLGRRRRAGRCPRRRTCQGGGGPGRQGLRPRTAQPHGSGTGS